MFKRLADKTDMFGPTPLGAVNRAIVGTPIDVLDYACRIGETALRGAATGAGKLAETLGMGEGMCGLLNAYHNAMKELPLMLSALELILRREDKWK